MNKKITVYCSSSDALEDSYYKAAHDMGALMVKNGYDLVFGGSNVGMMGAIARAVHSHGGKVTGVIPEFMHNRGIAYEASNELIVTTDLRERKKIMENRADAFIAMPGGFGTLEEILEVLTLKQLRSHTKPVILLNINGFFDPLAAFFELLYDGRFAKEDHRNMYFVAESCESVFEFLGSYTPALATSKWTEIN
ncbi:TIGR00730 family Rossman fold protein [bacterium]|nr:MAG: TIGR00730 family Rossman fold protein [bacterium]